MRSRVRARDNEELLDEADRLRFFAPRRPRIPLVERAALAKRLPPSYGVKWLTPRKLEIVEALSRRAKDVLLRDVASQLGLTPGSLQANLFEIRQRVGVHRSRVIPEAAYNLGLTRRRPVTH